MKSRADTTTKTYMRAVKTFFKWCKEKNIPIQLPLHAGILAMYVHEIDQKHTSVSSLNIVSAAIKWLHSLLPDDSPNPADNSFFQTILQAVKRKASRPVLKKKPLSTDIIKQMIDKFGSLQSNLKDLRTATFCAIGFAGFLRFDELIKIQPNHIIFHEEHIEILIPQSKTDVYREGNVVYITRSRTKYCPVDLLLRYMKEAKIDTKSSLPLFRQLSYRKKNNSYSLRASPLSYTTSREMFKNALTTLGLESKEYGLHSLRSGGAT